MINTKKEAKQLESTTVEIAQCPACEAITTHMYFMQDASTKVQSKWYGCSCGIVWQAHRPDFTYTKEYVDKYVPTGAKYESASRYLPQIIAPLIEESTYGRKMLMVGHYPHQLEVFRHRGWVPFTIDKNVNLATSERLIASDFETFTFPEDEKYALVWIYHVLESFQNPFEALKKVKNILSEDGILFIGTPDTDFLYTRGPAGFPHWKRDFNHILWNRRSLTSYLEKLGFDIVLSRRNYEQRFPAWDDCWILAQKKFF
jgi:hypothetical protein